jgi:hypothetical protein
MRISIDQKCIDEGIAGSAFSCPVALALDKAGVRHHGVTVNLVYLDSSSGPIELPARVSKFVQDFDSDKNVKPFRFNLPITA